MSDAATSAATTEAVSRSRTRKSRAQRAADATQKTDQEPKRNVVASGAGKSVTGDNSVNPTAKLESRPEAAAEPVKLTQTANGGKSSVTPVLTAKHTVANMLIKAGADLLDNWDAECGISAETARDYLTSWLSYMPGVGWDERLGPRTGAGRRKVA